MAQNTSVEQHLRQRVDEQIAGLTSLIDGDEDDALGAMLAQAVAVLRACAEVLCPDCGLPMAGQNLGTCRECDGCGQGSCRHQPDGECPERAEVNP